MTIGDVMAVTGSVIGICLSLWGLLLGLALLFEVRANQARLVLEEQPGRALATGAILVATLGTLSIALLNAPGGFKILGWVLLLSLLGLSAFGGSGLALLLSRRVAASAPLLSPLGALGRGAGLLAVAWVFPVLGWFLIGPLTVMISLGAGCRVLLKRRQRSVTPPAVASPAVAPPLTTADTPLDVPLEALP